MDILVSLVAENALFISNMLHFAFVLFIIGYLRYNLENRNNSHSRFMLKKFMLFTCYALIADLASYIFDGLPVFGALLGNHVSMFLSVFLTAYVGYLLNVFFDSVFRITDNQEKRRIYRLTRDRHSATSVSRRIPASAKVFLQPGQ